MPYKGPLTEEQIAQRRARNLACYHRNKGRPKTPEQVEKKREYQRVLMARWRAEHRERYLEQARKDHANRRERDPDAIRREMRESYYRRHEKRKAEKRAIHHANKETANAQRREHWRAHKDDWKEKRTMQRQNSRIKTPWTSLLAGARARSKKRNIEYSLTDEWAREHWTGKCEVTGIPFRLGWIEPGPKFFSPSIDKIDRKKGYTPDNCRIVLWAVNAMKYDGTDADMLMLAKAVVAALEKVE
jgi:hypothetical protein